MLTLKDIKLDFDKYFSPYNPSIMKDALSIIKDRSTLIELLESIYSDETALAMIAEKSYVHRNGFDKLVLLASSKPEFRLRIHIWWPNSDEISDMHIHNHKWDFRSKIIEGKYRHQEYIINDDGEKWRQYICHSILHKKGHQMEFQGIHRLQCVSDAILVKDCEYTLDHRVLHKVSVAAHSRLTSTIILQSPVLQSSTNVYSLEVLDKSLTQPRLCNTDEVKFKIKKYLDMIS